MFLQEIPDGLLEEVRLRRMPTYSTASWDDEGPTIILDDLGEKVQKETPSGGFLRNIDEL